MLYFVALSLAAAAVSFLDTRQMWTARLVYGILMPVLVLGAVLEGEPALAVLLSVLIILLFGLDLFRNLPKPKNPDVIFEGLNGDSAWDIPWREQGDDEKM